MKIERIRNLPENEQPAFRAFLRGQTVPLIPSVPDNEQDGFFWRDYENFKRKPEKRFFD
jgi:hypothetical protein